MKINCPKSSAGVTLIELLVVIAIMSVLAGVLFAIIDPIEQTKKANDVATKNAAVEFLAAASRYYMSRNTFPWGSVAAGGAACYSSTSLATIALSDLSACIQSLISTGEAKQTFANPNTTSAIYITNPSTITGSVSDNVACFAPQSKSQQNDPNTKYTSTGAVYSHSDPNIKCISKGGAVNCYWCAQ